MGDISKDIERSSSKKIAIGAVLGYVFLAVQVLAGFLFVPLISRHYGQEQYGLLTLSNSFVNLFLTDIGLSTISNKLLSSYRAEGKRAEIQSLLALIYKIYIAIAGVLLVVFCVLFFLSDHIFTGLSIDERGSFNQIFLVSSLASVLAFPMMSFDGVLNAYEEYGVVKVFSLIQKILYVVFVSLSLVFNWPIISIAIINCGSSLLCYGGKFLFVRFKLGCKANFKTKLPKSVLKGIFAYAIWQAGETITWRISNFASSPILGIVSDSSNIAIYGVAAEIEVYSFNLATVFYGLFLPKVSRIYLEKDKETRIKRIYSLATKSAILMSSIMLLITIGFIGCGSEFIRVWMNDSAYDPAYICTVLLMGGAFADYSNVVLTNCLYFDGNIKYRFFANLSSLVVFLLLSFPLGYFYGAVGVCGSLAFSKIVSVLVSSVFYKNRVGIPILKYYKDVYLKQMVPVFSGLLIGVCIHLFANLGPIYKILITVFAVTIPYFLLEWFFAYTKDLRDLILGLLKRRRKRNLSNN